MKRYAVVWRPAARADVIALYDWIAVRAEPDIAFAYSSRIEAHAAKLAEFPERGTPRDDLKPPGAAFPQDPAARRRPGER